MVDTTFWFFPKSVCHSSLHFSFYYRLL